jgi:vacuole morphology and inheritance protein 14
MPLPLWFDVCAAECERFNVEEFIPVLQGHIVSTNPHVKEMIVGWITTLDSVPDIEMLDYLPRLLDGLFSMLTDSNKDVKKVRAGSAVTCVGTSCCDEAFSSCIV